MLNTCRDKIRFLAHLRKKGSMVYRARVSSKMSYELFNYARRRLTDIIHKALRFLNHADYYSTFITKSRVDAVLN